MPRVNAIGVDGRVLAFSLTVASLTAILFGLVPALKASKPRLNTGDLWGRGSSSSLSQSRLGKVLIAAEVSLSVMLLVGAGLLLRTLWDLLHVDTGFQTSHLIAANVWLPVPNNPTADYYLKPEQRTYLIRESLRRLQAVPGVEGAAMSSVVPLQDTTLPAGFRVEGAPDWGDSPTAARAFVTPEFFKTLGAPLISGRMLDDADTIQTPLVALVDEAAAHRFWGDRNPIGQHIRQTRDISVKGKLQPAPWMTVVGVVSNVKLSGLDEQNVPHVYNSMYQFPGRLFGVLVRGTGDKAVLGRAIQHEIQTVDPNLPVANVSEMKEIMNTGVGDRRFAAWLLAIFSAIALILTSVGIYGVTSYAIALRTKELGIRSALGALPGDLVRMVMKNSMSPIVVGLIAGGIGAILAGRLMSALLYSVTSTDPFILAAAGAAVMIVGTAANLLPARRAARIDPIVALRVQ